MYYDPKEVTYERLLELFFDKVDPTTKDRQGNDSGVKPRRRWARPPATPAAAPQPLEGAGCRADRSVAISSCGRVHRQ